MVRDWDSRPDWVPIGFADVVRTAEASFGPDGFTTHSVRRGDAASDRRGGRRQLLHAAKERATELLRTHHEQFDRVVAALLEHETIDGSDLLALMASTRVRTVASRPPVERGP